MASYGTLYTLDTLAAASNTTVAEFGEDNAFQAVELAFQAHNAIMNDITAPLVERTTDRLRRYGGDQEMEMVEVDEFGQADAQKIGPGADVGFPLHLYAQSLQWTRKFFQNMVASEFAGQVTGIMGADIRGVNRELKRAIFRPTNNLTYTDRLVDHVTLPIRALVNADSEPIPPGPNGETFDETTHTHYLADDWTTTPDATALAGLIDTVIEHHAVGEAKVYINQAQEDDVRGFTGFKAYVDARIIPATDVDRGARPLDVTNVGNRAIGIFNEAEVWVKPWIPSGYIFAFVDGAPSPLVWRNRAANTGVLELVWENDAHPLRARSYEREFGIGVWTRTNGAVLYVGAGTYAAPTIN